MNPFNHFPKPVIFLLCACMLSLVSCGPVVALPPAAAIDAPQKLQNNQSYTLSSGDIVKMTVYGEDSLTGQYTLDRMGNISVPLIGDVHAAGLSKEGLQQSVGDTLKKGKYLANPLVTIDIVSQRPFYILGEVKTPGAFPWQPSMDVFKAVATAGGYTPRAAKSSVLIDRGEGDGKQRMNGNEETPILPGDSITVRERIF